jgi:hypothetical protein
MKPAPEGYVYSADLRVSFKLCYLESERPRTSVTERVLVVLKGPRRPRTP